MPLLVLAFAFANVLVARAFDLDIARPPLLPANQRPAVPFVGLGMWDEPGELRWERAYNGWEAVGSASRPAVDANFFAEPMIVASKPYAAGLGTYPTSEVEFNLGGQYSVLEVHIGIDDSSPSGAGALFSVAVDGSPVYVKSMRRGATAERVSIGVTGAKRLLLVTARDPAAEQIGLTNWADLRLFRTLVPIAGAPDPVALGAAQLRSVLGVSDPTAAEVERETQASVARSERDYVASRIVGSPGVTTFVDAERARYVLANQHIALIYDAAGEEPQSFTILDIREPKILLYRGSLRITVDGTRDIFLTRDTGIEEDNVRFLPVDEPGFGRGQSLQIRLRTRPDGAVVLLRADLFQDTRRFLLQADLAGAEPSQRIDYAFLQRLAGPTLVLGEDALLLSDLSYPRFIPIRDDGLIRSVVIDMGKPAVLQSEQLSSSIVLAAIDEPRRVSTLNLSVLPETRTALASFVVSSIPDATRSPRVYLEFNTSSDLRTATAAYKRSFAALYPPADLPPWVRFQWLSWYPFGIDISQQVISQQADLIARHFQDLGPWHVLVDAGWYVAEGRPGADLRAVDVQKFPDGMRKLVDELHAKGLKVLIYINTPMISAERKKDDWIGLRGTIEEHPEWLLSIGRRGEPGTYIFNYSHPGFRAYMHSLIEDIFVRYDADGMKIDGLGGGEGLPVRRGQRDPVGLISQAVNQTSEILRFTAQSARRLKSDLYFEGGYHNPGFAQSYAHTFRYGDDAPKFSSPYPVDGFVEHVDYATYMKTILGQRPNMGALNHEQGDDPHNLNWLRAAIALDAFAELSFDLSTLDANSVATYRALLNHHRPFTGETSVDGVIKPSVFVTRETDVTYVGLLNRAGEARTFNVRLSDYGVQVPSPQAVFDTATLSAKRVDGVFEDVIPAMSFRLYVVARAPRVVWSSSKYLEARSERSISVELSGPTHVPGYVNVALPGAPKTVAMDGVQLRPGSASPGPGEYGLTPEGLLTVVYGHDRSHTLVVDF